MHNGSPDEKTTINGLPRWSLDSIYPDFESNQYRDDKQALIDEIAAIGDVLAAKIDRRQPVLDREQTCESTTSEEPGSAQTDEPTISEPTTSGKPEPELDGGAATNQPGLGPQRAGQSGTGERFIPETRGESADGPVASTRHEHRKHLKAFISRYNSACDLYENLSSYAYCRYSVDTTDTVARKEINRLEKIVLPLHELLVEFRNQIAAVPDIWTIVETDEELSRFAFFFTEELLFRKKQMSTAEEALAEDLARAGGNAWSRLQEQVSSTMTSVWDEVTGEQKTVVELRLSAHHRDRAVRRRAYTLELDAWKRNEIPLAAALNGVTGFSTTLESRRGYKSPLEKAILQSRISEPSLDALIETIQSSLPIFRTYLNTKAKLLGLSQLAFFDLFAPLQPAGKTEAEAWPFERVRSLIIDAFSRFSTELGSFADYAFQGGWIDAPVRKGKVGGGYCISFPLAEESRVFINYDHTFSSVMTIAHELGHAYHHHVLRDAPAVHRSYPMTLAETASGFCEHLVIDAVLRTTTEDVQKLLILEQSLQDSTQVIVDILSRFLFEKAVFDRRAESELSPGEFCELMLEAQKHSYGDGLDPEFLHPYMWAVKGHYYNHNLPFYNFPYAFGLLFGLGLFDRYRAEGPSFAGLYNDILMQTGKATAVQVTRDAGFDIESTPFWQAGIDTIAGYVEDYVSLASRFL